MGIAFRELQSADLNSLPDFSHRFPETSHYTSRNEPYRVYFGAVDDAGCVLAVAILGVSERIISIDYVERAEDAKGRGIGKPLLEAIFHYAAERNATLNISGFTDAGEKGLRPHVEKLARAFPQLHAVPDIGR